LPVNFALKSALLVPWKYISKNSGVIKK